jgi:CheY-like chemotaxis protein
MANRKETVLVVQQKTDWRDLLIHVIERCGYGVIAVDNPEGIIESATHGLDIILLDLELVKEQAEMLIPQLQNCPSTQQIPIICEIRYGNDSLARRAIQAGAKEILYKPFDLSDLPSILRQNRLQSTEEKLA